MWHLHVHSACVFSDQNFDRSLSNRSYMHTVSISNGCTYEISNCRFDGMTKKEMWRWLVGRTTSFILLNIWYICIVWLMNALVYDFSNCLFGENLFHNTHRSKGEYSNRESNECFHLAYPWFEVLMNSHMCIQCWWTIESFAAYATAVWLFRCMNNLMATKCWCLSEAFSTYLMELIIN